MLLEDFGVNLGGCGAIGVAFVRRSHGVVLGEDRARDEMLRCRGVSPPILVDRTGE